MVSIRMHEVCLNCQKDCKQQYTEWSGCMPPSEYCEKFERKRGGWRTKQ